MERNPLKIVILGSGNVATFFAKRLSKVANVSQIWSRDIAHARQLSEYIGNITAICNLQEICDDADFYIIAVADDAIQSVASNLPPIKHGIVVHTSGSVPLAKLMDSLLTGTKAGVLYPLQTFSKQREINNGEVPLLIEGSSETVSSDIVKLAELVSDNVIKSDSSVRGHIHIAAVFANNFTNYMLDIADQYLRDNTGLDIRILQPLLEETISKAIKIGPHKAQTGPAVRKDDKIIESHLGKLSPKDAEIYKFLTERIIKDHFPDTTNK